MSEGNTLGDVALESFYTSLEEGLLALVEIFKWVNCLLSPIRLFSVSDVDQNMELCLPQAQRERKRSLVRSP